MTAIRQPSFMRLGTNHRLILPRDLCEKHGLFPGVALEILETKRGLLIRPAPKKDLMSLQERIARTSVTALRSAGQWLRDEPSVGREHP